MAQTKRIDPVTREKSLQSLYLSASRSNRKEGATRSCEKNSDFHMSPECFSLSLMSPIVFAASTVNFNDDRAHMC